MHTYKKPKTKPLKKLKSKNGETLVETLISMLIVVLSVTMLAGSIVTAARINQTAKEMNVPVQLDTVQTSDAVDAVVYLTHDNVTSYDSINVTLYTTADPTVPYYYYEKK